MKELYEVIEKDGAYKVKVTRNGKTSTTRLSFPTEERAMSFIASDSCAPSYMVKKSAKKPERVFSTPLPFGGQTFFGTNSPTF